MKEEASCGQIAGWANLGNGAAQKASEEHRTSSATATRSHAEEPKSQVTRSAPGWKRTLDLGCLIASLPLVLPLVACVALLIKGISRGPVFFRQQRVGFRGRRFTCLKFRTMAVNANTALHEAYCRNLISTGSSMAKLDEQEDRRIIPFGVGLRSLGLDELPQLVNVLRGEMSLVGPRPCLPAEYDAHTPEQRRRFDTLPGLTGLWQVSGKNTTTFEQMIQLDLEYIRRRTLRFDLLIMLKTLPVLLKEGLKASRRRLVRAGLLPSASDRTGMPSRLGHDANHNPNSI